MTTREENDLMTLVEGDAPMGRMIRENYWMPFGVSTQLVAHAEPMKVRLLGQNYVAFRDTKGKIGFFDEACPHRSASLALARNEGDGLRCIFHGWKFSAEGKCVEVPSQATKHDEFCAKVPVRHYPVVDGGGILWVWLGKAAAPKFPELPFVNNPKADLFMTVSVSDCNWLQGVEGTVDSVHVQTLHQSWVVQHMKRVGGSIGMSMDAPPRYEVAHTEYGLRAAALRARKDGTTYARVTEYFMPYVCLVPGRDKENGVLFMAVPIDNHKHLLFFGQWSETEKIVPSERLVLLPGAPYDPHNMVKLRGNRDNNYGQDRNLMSAGHFTGFSQNIVEEDVVVQVSMGPIVDRTKEFLSETDVAIVQMRRSLLKSLREFEAGRLPLGSALADKVMSPPIPVDTLLQPGVHWEDFSYDQAAA